MELLETIKNFVHTACLSVLLILIGAAALWAVGAYYQVEAKKPIVTVYQNVDHAAFQPGDMVNVTVTHGPLLPDEGVVTVEAWHPISKEVDLHASALRTLAELDRLVKEQSITIEEARKEAAQAKKERGER